MIDIIKRILIAAIIVESIGLGFFVGQTHVLKKQINKQNQCLDEVNKKTFDINKDFGIKLKELSLESIFALSDADVSSYYAHCILGKEK